MKSAASLPPQAPSALPRARVPATASKKRGGKAEGKVVALGVAATPTMKGPSVQWDTNPTCTDKLVSWILNHPADCNVLFHDHLLNSPPPVLSPEERPSGKNKKDITAVIAKHIFQDDLAYSVLYASDPGKFTLSVTNQLGT